VTEPPNRDWIGRVKQADREAEAAYCLASEMAYEELSYEAEDQTRLLSEIAQNLHALAAELRAQRIARRPGAGQ
jgi:PHD/YefM family antitoxin component YafN of YafNO toxin-antitoxin module